MLTGEQREKRKEEVFNFLKQGYSNANIATELKLSVSVVSTTASDLAKEGKIIPRSRGTPPGIRGKTLEPQRLQTVISMFNQREPLRDIGIATHLSHESVRKVIRHIVKKYGEEILNPTKLTILEASILVGTSPSTIRTICIKGDVNCRQRKNGKWLIEKTEIEKLQKHPLVVGKNICVVCKKAFHANGTQIICSDKCREKRKDQLHRKLTKEKATIESLASWRKILFEKLSCHSIPRPEKWLTRKQASKLTGLTNMQINWLRIRHLVTVRRHPRKKWRGHGVTLYSKSEMEIAGQIYEEYKNNNGKH